MTDQPLSRRERQRRATMNEIVRTARTQLGEPGGLSLRAIAQEMGMTPPALYRYVTSLEELTLIVAGSVYDELVEALHEARRRHLDAGPEAQIIGSAVAFRQWALRHRDEFVLCFVHDVSDPQAPDRNACEAAGTRFRQFFAGLFIEIWRRRPFEVPGEERLSHLQDALVDTTNPFVDADGNPTAPDVPAGAQWVFLQVWTRLFGIVALEVFGHIARPLVESGALFRDVLGECGRTIGIDPATVPGFEAPMEAELAR